VLRSNPLSLDKDNAVTTSSSHELISLDVDTPIWDNFFTVAPLVIVGSREDDGGYDLAPKHMVTPLGWDNYFGFVCTPRHSTYHNVQREGAFTVTFPKADQLVATSLAAAPRCGHDDKPALGAVSTFPATEVDGELVEHGYLFLECRLDRVIDAFGPNSLITGRIVAARADTRALRGPDRDDQDVIAASPLLVYLAPGRWAQVEQTNSFPFHAGFKR